MTAHTNDPIDNHPGNYRPFGYDTRRCVTCGLVDRTKHEETHPCKTRNCKRDRAGEGHAYCEDCFAVVLRTGRPPEIVPTLDPVTSAWLDLAVEEAQKELLK